MNGEELKFLRGIKKKHFRYFMIVIISINTNIENYKHVTDLIPIT